MWTALDILQLTRRYFSWAMSRIALNPSFLSLLIPNGGEVESESRRNHVVLCGFFRLVLPNLKYFCSLTECRFWSSVFAHFYTFVTICSHEHFTFVCISKRFICKSRVTALQGLYLYLFPRERCLFTLSSFNRSPYWSDPFPQSSVTLNVADSRPLK